MSLVLRSTVFVPLFAALALCAPFALHAAGGETAPAPKVQRGADARTERVAMEAWRRFLAAWDSGDWQPFLAMTTDDFQFQFPAGPQAGRRDGAAGKAALLAWIGSNRGVRIAGRALDVTVAGDTAVFESYGESVPAEAYRNFEAIVFVVEGDRIRAMREYWGLADPSPANAARPARDPAAPAPKPD